MENERTNRRAVGCVGTVRWVCVIGSLSPELITLIRPVTLVEGCCSETLAGTPRLVPTASKK